MLCRVGATCCSVAWVEGGNANVICDRCHYKMWNFIKVYDVHFHTGEVREEQWCLECARGEDYDEV